MLRTTMSLPNPAPLDDRESIRTLPSEAELIERARTDAGAFDALYRAHRRPITDHVHRRIGDPAATEEIVADVFVAAWRALPKYEQRGVPLRAWLFRIAANFVRRHVRDSLRRSAALGDVAAPSPSDDANVLRIAIAELPDELEEVIVLHHLESIELDEIAEWLGLPVGTVKSRLHRARAALKARLTASERKDGDR